MNAEQATESTYGALLHRFVSYEPVKRVLPAVLLYSASVLTASLASAERSTYVCPLALNDRRKALLLQVLGVCLDCFVLTAIAELTGQRKKEATARSRNAPLIVGIIFSVRFL